MFTGIISNLGKLRSRRGAVFTFQAAPVFCRKVSKGTSIAVNGACLTAVRKTRQTFTVEVMPETLRRTGFVKLQTGDSVNLELPATPQTFLSGHIVQGHIDEVGIVKRIDPAGNSQMFTILVPRSLTKYIVEKGSIAVNGIALTVVTARPESFTVAIIPHTWKQTMLRKVKVGDGVNIEVDILGKYLEKLYKHHEPR